MHFFFPNVCEGLCNEMLGTCSENDENGCGFGMPLEAAENRKLFFLVTKVLSRGRRVMKKVCP